MCHAVYYVNPYSWKQHEMIHIQLLVYAEGKNTAIACFASMQSAIKACGRPNSIHIISHDPDAGDTTWESLTDLFGNGLTSKPKESAPAELKGTFTKSGPLVIALIPVDKDDRMV